MSVRVLWYPQYTFPIVETKNSIHDGYHPGYKIQGAYGNCQSYDTIELDLELQKSKLNQTN